MLAANVDIVVFATALVIERVIVARAVNTLVVFVVTSFNVDVSAVVALVLVTFATDPAVVSMIELAVVATVLKFGVLTIVVGLALNISGVVDCGVVEVDLLAVKEAVVDVRPTVVVFGELTLGVADVLARTLVLPRVKSLVVAVLVLEISSVIVHGIFGTHTPNFLRAFSKPPFLIKSRNSWESPLIVTPIV